MITIGLDGGLNGGICVCQNNTILDVFVMPIIKGNKGNIYDTNKIIKIFNNVLILSKTQNEQVLALLEKAHTMPLNGGKANFTTGECYGIMKGILKSLKIPFEIVAAKTWQKEIFQGQTVKDTKQSSILYCKNKFPSIDWRASERCRKDHDGKTDACCIAIYGSRL